MLAGLTALIAGAGEAAIAETAIAETVLSETAAETAVSAAELENVQELMAVLDESTVPETFSESIPHREGWASMPLARGSLTAQMSRLSDRAAALLQDAAVRRNAEAALVDDAAQAEVMQKTAELLEDIAQFSDAAGDYLGMASYPEFMLRHSPGNQ